MFRDKSQSPPRGNKKKFSKILAIDKTFNKKENNSLI